MESSDGSSSAKQGLTVNERHEEGKGGS